MNVVDSSGWLEVFTDGENAERYLPYLRDPDELVVPTICIYEVTKVVLRERGEDDAIQAAAAMQRGTIADLTLGIATAAPKLSLRHGLPLADSIILATARAYSAEIWTQDADFEGIEGVTVLHK